VLKYVFRLGLTALMVTALVTVGDGSQQAEAAECRIKTPDSAFAAEVADSPGHARVWRLYQAFYLRQPDRGGIDYWTSVRSGGTELSDIAYQFAVGPEFQALYGQLTNGEFVDLVYTNVLCRTAEGEGRAYWVGLLDSGSLTRWDMMVNFVELEEYLTRTATCNSLYPAQSAAVPACPESKLVPLAQASLAADGYEVFDAQLGAGSFKGVQVDLNRKVFRTGSSRCSVASINGNWLVGSEKDKANPGVLGVGVVNGTHVKNSSDRSDRGVFGMRFDPNPKSVVEVWPGDTLSDDDRRMNSVAYQNGSYVLESWYASAETSHFLTGANAGNAVAADDWIWAAAGIPLVLDGQIDPSFSQAYNNDSYTYQTLGHTFVAIDQDTQRLVFGGTTTADTKALVDWATANGYEDLIKFDGGGSTEFNVAGQAVVDSTPRDIPVWLGIGCS